MFEEVTYIYIKMVRFLRPFLFHLSSAYVLITKIIIRSQDLNASVGIRKTFKLDIPENDVIYVDDLASLQIMDNLLFPHIERPVIENSLRSQIEFVALDCEWRPEGIHSKTAVVDTSLTTEEIFSTITSSKPAGSQKTGRKAKKGGLQTEVVTVLQLATRHNVFVIDLLRICHQLGGGTSVFRDENGFISGISPSKTELKFNSIITALYTNPRVVIIGMGVHQDLKRLAWSYPWLQGLQRIEGVMDVSALAKLAYPDVSKREMEGLSKLSSRILGLTVSKEEQVSDWGSRPLSPNQIRYAAIDALVQVRIVDAILHSSALAVTATPFQESSAISNLFRSVSITLPVVSTTKVRSKNEIFGCGAKNDVDEELFDSYKMFLRSLVVRDKPMHKS